MPRAAPWSYLNPRPPKTLEGHIQRTFYLDGYYAIFLGGAPDERPCSYPDAYRLGCEDALVDRAAAGIVESDTLRNRDDVRPSDTDRCCAD